MGGQFPPETRWSVCSGKWVEDHLFRGGQFGPESGGQFGRNLHNYCRTQKIEVKIYNLPGKYILQKSLNECECDIDIHSFRKGLYIIEINNDHETVQLKMIKK